jgi:hypothetical protein
VARRLTERIYQKNLHFELLISQAESFSKRPITRREREVVARMVKELRAQHESDIGKPALALAKEIMLLGGDGE